jgi:hypothetical protein
LASAGGVTRAGRVAGLTVLLAGPVALAFFSGGYFDEPRLWAALVAWALVLVVALAAPVPLPRSTAGRLALGGLALLAGWEALSERWAPLADVARHDAQRVVLYVGVLVAAAALVRGRRAVRAAELAVAAGSLVVVGYGLSERLLPGLLRFHRGMAAGGRLEQPLTYWNAMGLVAAIGVVLCARVAADPERRRAIAAAAAGVAVPLSLGVLLSFSRGALAALAVGLLALLAVDPRPAQLRVIVALVLFGGLAAVAGDLMPAVRALEGSPGSRELQGAATLGVVVLLALGAAATVRRIRQPGGEQPVLARHRRVIPVAALVVCLATVGLEGAIEHPPGSQNPSFGATTARLGSIQSNRYEYWRVAVSELARHPLLGAGSGAFRVAWLRHRTVEDPALNAHSLYLETAAELGLVGLALLAAFGGGLVGAARRAYRRRPALAAGPLAVLSVYALHAGIDWDWQMPAATLPALVLAGALIGLADDPAEA